jgi:hypothetical protein
MIKAILNYIAKEALPRWKEILFGSELWVALIAGAYIALYPDSLHSLNTSKSGDIGSLLLTYAAIALGFALTGMTVVLTLPEREFANKLATAKIEKDGNNSYADLLFVFSWTSVCHWVLLLSAMTYLLCFGFEAEVFKAETLTNCQKVVMGVLAFEMIYCLCQFLITVITLSQVGNHYISFLNSNGSKK